MEAMIDARAPIRIAMWSGPRNISTAMMRSWGSRADTVVIDEPFYACYLERTGKKHPGAEEIIARSETDWREIVNQLTASGPTDRIFFQKQMTHHLLPEIDREWLVELTNCFLIRDPREVILSYIKKNPEPVLADLGFVQQREIFDFVRARRDAVGVDFDPAMLSWPPGLRDTDGIWAKYWYDDVARSTTFQPYRPKNEPVPNQFREIYVQCRECYELLYANRLR
jgi:hypothetical protein